MREQDWIVIPVGDVDVDLRSHETIVRTGRQAGLNDAQILQLCHLAEVEAELDAQCRRLAESDAPIEQRLAALSANVDVLEQIKVVCRSARSAVPATHARVLVN